MTTDDKFDRVVRSRWATVAVLALSFLLYLPSIGNAFSMDDDPIARSKCNQYPELHGDPMITGHFESSKWEYFVKFFQKHYWWPESYNDGLYRPISVLSYGLTYQAIGRHLDEDDEALPQHAINVVIHVWAVWLVLALLSAVGATRRIALLTALLFGVHAIHSEVVSGIIGRAEMFSFCFGAQAMVWMLRGAWWRYWSAAFFMFLAYGSKEISLCWIPFFFCLVLARGWLGDSGGSMLDPLRRRQSALALLALLVPAIAWFGLRHIGMQSDPIMDAAADFSSNPLAHTSATERILTGIKVWGYGLWLCFVPVKLSCIYSPHVFEIVDSPANPAFLASLAALLGLLGGGLWFARKQPLLFLAMTCFLGFSFITSNVPMAIGTIFGERLYYTPSVGTCLLMALLLPRLRGGAARAFLIALGLWCVGNVVVASIRVADWRDSPTLFLADVKKYPMAIDLHRKVAQSYMDEGPSQNYDKAIEHFETAITLKSNYAHAFRGLGKIYQARREWDEAIAAYKQSYDRGYPDPEGAESIAFNAIGDCYLSMAAESESDAVQLQHIATAGTWFEKSLAAPLFGDSWGEANNRVGDCQIQLSKLEKSDGGKERVIRRALQIFFRTIEMRPIDKPSRLAAFERVFQYAFEPKALLSPKRIHELYVGAADVVGEDPELTLLMGVAAYKAGLPAMMVLQPLHAAIMTFPESKRNADFYTTNALYADTLLEVGRGVEARQVFEMLLGRPEIDEAKKAKIRVQLETDPRLKR